MNVLHVCVQILQKNEKRTVVAAGCVETAAVQLGKLHIQQLLCVN